MCAVLSACAIPRSPRDAAAAAQLAPPCGALLARLRPVDAAPRIRRVGAAADRVDAPTPLERAAA